MLLQSNSSFVYPVNSLEYRWRLLKYVIYLLPFSSFLRPCDKTHFSPPSVVACVPEMSPVARLPRLQLCAKPRRLGLSRRQTGVPKLHPYLKRD